MQKDTLPLHAKLVGSDVGSIFDGLDRLRKGDEDKDGIYTHSGRACNTLEKHKKNMKTEDAISKSK